MAVLIACVRMFVDSAQSGRHKALVQATPVQTRRPKRKEFRSEGEGCKVHTGLFQLFLYVKSKSTCVNNAWLGTLFHGFDAPLTADIAASVCSSASVVTPVPAWPYDCPTAAGEFPRAPRLLPRCIFAGKESAPPACAGSADVNRGGLGFKGHATSAITFVVLSRSNGPAWPKAPPPKATEGDVNVCWRDKVDVCDMDEF